MKLVEPLIASFSGDVGCVFRATLLSSGAAAGGRLQGEGFLFGIGGGAGDRAVFKPACGQWMV